MKKEKFTNKKTTFWKTKIKKQTTKQNLWNIEINNKTKIFEKQNLKKRKQNFCKVKIKKINRKNKIYGEQKLKKQKPNPKVLKYKNSKTKDKTKCLKNRNKNANKNSKTDIKTKVLKNKNWICKGIWSQK